MDRKTFTEAYDKMRPDFAYREQGGVGIYTLPAFSARPEIDHGFSARILKYIYTFSLLNWRSA